MDGNPFDRIVKAFAATSARRQTLRASLGGAAAAAIGLVGQDTEAKKKRKKKKKKTCSNLTETCASTASCCDAQSGDVACRQQLATKPGNCATLFSGLRCCAVEDALCNPNDGNCACCDDLVCGLANDGKFRCAPTEL